MVSNLITLHELNRLRSLYYNLCTKICLDASSYLKEHDEIPDELMVCNLIRLYEYE